jgi:hypothetical protein
MATLKFCPFRLSTTLVTTCLAIFIGDEMLFESVATASPIIKSGTAHSNQGLPDFQEVEEVVKKTLAGNKKYYEYDLITQSDAVKVISQIKSIGWEVPDSRKIVGRFLPQGDFLVKQLYSRRGKAFMRKISKMPGGYDRIDRLRYIPKGKRAVTSLIKSKGGEEMIKYMTTTQQGKNMGSLVSKSRNGRNFNKLTGRIYTGKQLIEELKELHQQALITANKQSLQEKKKKKNSEPASSEPATPKTSKEPEVKSEEAAG